jgi:hypothetical protein
MKIQKFEMPYVVRGQLLVLKGEIHPEDRSVGIFGPFLDGFMLYEVDGVTPHGSLYLEQEECDAIFEDPKVQEAVEKAYYKDYPDEYGGWSVLVGPRGISLRGQLINLGD